MPKINPSLQTQSHPGLSSVKAAQSLKDVPSPPLKSKHHKGIQKSKSVLHLPNPSKLHDKIERRSPHFNVGHGYRTPYPIGLPKNNYYGGSSSGAGQGKPVGFFCFA